MNKVLIGLIGAAGAMLVASCADTFNPGGDSDRQGRIFPSVDLDKNVVTSKSTPKAPASRSAEAVPADQMEIRLVRDAGGYDKTWTSLADFPSEELFPVGSYTFSASYGSDREQGFGKPYYYGECAVNVEENRAAQVQLTAQLANSMLTIAYSEAFSAYFTDYATTLTTALGSLEYTSDAAEPVYLPAGEVSFAIAVTKPSGTKATLTPNAITLKPRHHYTVKFDINGGNVASPVLSIEWDEMLDEEVVEIDLSDDLINAPAPVLTAEGFPVESFIAGNAPEGTRSVTVVAHGGISSIVMTTSSPSLREQGWPAETDLLAGDAAANAATAALGLATRGLSKPGGKIAQVTLTDVLGHIGYVEGASNTTEFTFVARDAYNKESEPLTLTVDIEKLIIELSNPSAIVKGQTDFSCDLEYNGGNPDDNVTIQAKNERGTWSDLPATFTPVSRAIGHYLVEVTVDGERDTQLRARSADGSVSEPLDVIHAEAPHALSIDNRDSYAHSTKVTLIDNPNYSAAASRSLRKSAADMAAKATLQVSTDGKAFANAANAALSGTTWTVTGLDAGKTYYFRAIVDALPCVAVSTATEAAAQLENSGLEDWTSEKKTNLAANVTVWSLGGNWGTLNPYTTGYLASGSSYSAISSTAKDENGHNGSCALIRSVGFDVSSNTAGLNNPKKYSCGELFLGSYDGGAKYGIEFNSRPAGISFWYKYAPTNSADKGYAEITVYDSAGNVIATGSEPLPSCGDFTPASVKLTYPTLAEKAAKISVVFRSTNAGNTHLNSTDIPKHTSWSVLNDYYVGSQLYVDDVELTY
ncbi:MAG: DUF4493 domain-containing protein [Muribaculaceae bacterium]|nr:DUF4493 domain-containing protein [Muribaculaceae bacterium]